jgi:hypothetical protein
MFLIQKKNTAGSGQINKKLWGYACFRSWTSKYSKDNSPISMIETILLKQKEWRKVKRKAI